jgi:hypothetical protein
MIKKLYEIFNHINKNDIYIIKYSFSLREKKQKIFEIQSSEKFNNKYKQMFGFSKSIVINEHDVVHSKLYQDDGCKSNVFVGILQLLNPIPKGIKRTFNFNYFC